MRTIKFRAWDKEEERMYLIYKLAFPNHDSGAIKLLKNNSQPESVEWQSIGSVELMQYTGLKDKNGKEIYEGDVCIVDDSGEYFPQELNEKTDEYEPTGKYLIKWSEDSAGFWLDAVDGSDLELEWNPFGYAEFEVIGNIYSNPELLTKGKE